MLSTALLLTFLIAFDPVRLGTILLLISRPRPVRSLTAYWVGAMTVSVPYLLVPLTLLHVTPVFRSFAQHIVAQATVGSPTVRHTQIGLGALVLSIAAVLTVRLWARRRAYLPLSVGTGAGTPSTMVMDSPVMASNTPIATAEPVVAQDASAQRRSAMRRLRGRTRRAWDSGAPWVALVMGLASGPPPLTTLLVLTTIMASEAAIGAQVTTALGWVVVMFAVVEIILVSYVAWPAKTLTLLKLVHNWTLAHRRQVVVTILAVIGAGLVVHGMGGV